MEASKEQNSLISHPELGGEDGMGFTTRDKCRSQYCKKSMQWGILAVATILVSSFTISLYTNTRSRPLFPQPNHPDQHNGQWTNCGTSIDEALDRGCMFDVMGNNWVPPLCHDTKFADSAAAGNNSFARLFGTQWFEWFDQPLQEGPIGDLEDYLITKARRGEEVTAYTTENWHIAHCMYWFSVGVNAMDRLNTGERDVWVPRVVRKPAHARHCGMITGHLFREESLKEDIITPKVIFGYATCVRLA